MLAQDPCALLDEVRETDRERFQHLARDYDGQGGRQTDSSRCEARLSLTLEYRELLDGPVSRPPWGDICDRHGQLWDIKSPRSGAAIVRDRAVRAQKTGRIASTQPPRGGVFRLDIEVQRVVDQQELEFGVVVDMRRLELDQAQELVAAILAHPRIDLELVRFFPPDLSAFSGVT